MWPTGLSFASHLDGPSQHWMRRPASQESRLRGAALCGLRTVRVRNPACLQSDRGGFPTTMATAATVGSIPMGTKATLAVGKAMDDGVVGKGLAG